MSVRACEASEAYVVALIQLSVRDGRQGQVHASHPKALWTHQQLLPFEIAISSIQVNGMGRLIRGLIGLMISSFMAPQLCTLCCGQVAPR